MLRFLLFRGRVCNCYSRSCTPADAYARWGIYMLCFLLSWRTGVRLLQQILRPCGHTCAQGHSYATFSANLRARAHLLQQFLSLRGCICSLGGYLVARFSLRFLFSRLRLATWFVFSVIPLAGCDLVLYFLLFGGRDS